MSHDYQVVTLVIAVLGLALSVASLSWQAAAFVLSGSRVKVELRHGAQDGVGNLMHGPPGTHDARLLASQGFVHELLGVQVRNVGRMPVDVEKVEAVLPKGIRFSHPQGHLGPSLPHRVQPHSSQTWFLDMQPIRKAVYANAQTFGLPATQPVYVAVGLGTGKTAETNQRILVPGGGVVSG
jgi:hypothetical protein